jgi:hypothetical protein
MTIIFDNKRSKAQLSDADLAKNARIINTEHKAVVEATQAKLQHAITAGETLKACKDSMAHGAWANWLKANCPEISERTASVYMRLAKNSDKVEQAAGENSSGAADLSIRAMLKLLAKQKTEEQKAKAKPKPKTTTKAAVEPPDADDDEEIGKEWLRALAVDDLITWLKEVHDADYLKDLAAALTKALTPPPKDELAIPPALQRPPAQPATPLTRPVTEFVRRT